MYIFIADSHHNTIHNDAYSATVPLLFNASRQVGISFMIRLEINHPLSNASMGGGRVS